MSDGLDISAASLRLTQALDAIAEAQRHFGRGDTNRARIGVSLALYNAAKAVEVLAVMKVDDAPAAPDHPWIDTTGLGAK